MPPARHVPELPAAGAPVSVLVDYDGTISRRDIGDLLLRRHVADADALSALDVAYDAGTLGSADLMRRDMDLLPDPADVLVPEAAAVPQDPGIVALADVVVRNGAAIEVVSDGLGFYVGDNLARIGLGWIPVATNTNELRGGGAGMAYPYTHPACGWCGTCKRERVRAHASAGAGRIVLLVGDGTSDRYAAHHADVVLATGALAAWCARSGIPAVRWTELDEVAGWVAAAFADGRLPRDAADVPAARARLRSGTPARPSFICGPEAWGDGRPPTGDRARGDAASTQRD
ncbi:MAG: hypothetical protein ACKOTZ_04965 [Chloroflexota bacterium]